MLQSLLVLVLVAGSFVYATWALLPQAARRGVAQGLLRWPLPRIVAGHLQRAARAQAGCSCSGCDRAPAKSMPNVGPIQAHAAQPQPVHFHPRQHR